MKKPKKHHVRFCRAHGEQLERMGLVVDWRRDGGFTVKPRSKKTSPEIEKWEIEG